MAPSTSSICSRQPRGRRHDRGRAACRPHGDGGHRTGAVARSRLSSGISDGAGSAGAQSGPRGTCVRGGPAESARLGRKGLPGSEPCAAPSAADAGARAAPGTAVGGDADVAEALCLAVGVRGALTGLRAEDVLRAGAREIAHSTEAIRAIADVTAARPTRRIAASTACATISRRHTLTELPGLPFGAPVDRRRGRPAGQDGRCPRRGTRQPDVAKHLTTRDPFVVHYSPTRGRPAESARLERKALPGSEPRAAPSAANGRAVAAARAAVERDADVPEALGLAVSVRHAMAGLRAEDVLSAIALAVAVPNEAVRAVSDVAAARAAVAGPARANGEAARVTPAKPVRPPLPAAVGRGGRSRSRDHRRGPCRDAGDPDAAEQLSARDPLLVHPLPANSSGQASDPAPAKSMAGFLRREVLTHNRG